MGNLDWSQINIRLLMGERNSTYGEPDDSNNDEDDSNNCSSFHMASFSKRDIARFSRHSRKSSGPKTQRCTSWIREWNGDEDERGNSSILYLSVGQVHIGFDACLILNVVCR